MFSSDTIGQERVKRILQRTIEKDRLPHALLFHGSEGVGKDAIALEVARIINCTDQGDSDCPSCRKIRKGHHPDVHLILPLPAKIKPEEAAAHIQEKSADPYCDIAVSRTSMITISVMRELQKRLSYKPFEGKRKIAVISGADRMNTEAANSFLKTLEEPPPDTLLVLTTANLHKLLPTIVSRCQQIRFDPLHEDDIEKALEERDQIGSVQARLISRLSLGNYRLAREFLENDVDSMRDEALELLQTAMTGAIADYVEKAENVSGRIQGGELKNILNMSLIWVRDLLLILEHDNPGLTNIDRTDQLQQWTKQLNGEVIQCWIKVIQETVDLIDRNINQQLIVTGLLLRLYRELQAVSHIA